MLKWFRGVRDIQRVCRKYRIPFEDVGEVLEEYIYNDNIGWSDDEDE